MPDDEVSLLRDILSAHRSMLMGALQGNDDLDIDRAFQIHATLFRILAHWDEFTAKQQRDIFATVEYVVNTDDRVPDLTHPAGFTDDLEQVRRLQDSLGYV